MQGWAINTLSLLAVAFVTGVGGALWYLVVTMGTLATEESVGENFKEIVVVKGDVRQLTNDLRWTRNNLQNAFEAHVTEFQAHAAQTVGYVEGPSIPVPLLFVKEGVVHIVLNSETLQNGSLAIQPDGAAYGFTFRIDPSSKFTMKAEDIQEEVHGDLTLRLIKQPEQVDGILGIYRVYVVPNTPQLFREFLARGSTIRWELPVAS